jgi:hypothetical protein
LSHCGDYIGKGRRTDRRDFYVDGKLKIEPARKQTTELGLRRRRHGGRSNLEYLLSGIEESQPVEVTVTPKELRTTTP